MSRSSLEASGRRRPAHELAVTQGVCRFACLFACRIDGAACGRSILLGGLACCFRGAGLHRSFFLHALLLHVVSSHWFFSSIYRIFCSVWGRTNLPVWLHESLACNNQYAGGAERLQVFRCSWLCPRLADVGANFLCRALTASHVSVTIPPYARSGDLGQGRTHYLQRGHLPASRRGRSDIELRRPALLLHRIRGQHDQQKLLLRIRQSCREIEYSGGDWQQACAAGRCQPAHAHGA